MKIHGANKNWNLFINYLGLITTPGDFEEVLSADQFSSCLCH